MDIKINLSGAILDLAGLPLKGTDSLGKLLASALSQSAKGDSLKMFNWAMKFYGDEPITVDESDYKVLENFINSAEHPLTHLVKAQILQAMEKAKTSASTKLDKKK